MTRILIPILHNGGKQAVDARELHKFLEVGKDFTTWIKDRIAAFGFVAGTDFDVCSPISGSKECGEQSKGRGGHNTVDYLISLDMAKELSMVERSDKGKEARRYFIECENRLRSMAMPVRIPATLSEALQLGADLAREKEELESLTLQQKEEISEQRAQITELEETVEEQLPKVEALDRISEAEGDMCVTDAAKILQMLRKDLLYWMERNGWIYRRNGNKEWIAYHAQRVSGRLRMISHEHTLPDKTVVVHERLRITPKGLVALALKLGKTLPPVK